MDDFGKFQPHQTADDKVLITFGSSFAFFKSFLEPFSNAFCSIFKFYSVSREACGLYKVDGWGLYECVSFSLIYHMKFCLRYCLFG